MIEKKIKKILEKKIKSSKIFITDVTGNNDHFSIIVISNIFKDYKLVDRQKMVYNALDGIMNDIHALQMKTITFEEWKKEN